MRGREGCRALIERDNSPFCLWKVVQKFINRMVGWLMGGMCCRAYVMWSHWSGKSLFSSRALCSICMRAWLPPCSLKPMMQRSWYFSELPQRSRNCFCVMEVDLQGWTLRPQAMKACHQHSTCHAWYMQGRKGGGGWGHQIVPFLIVQSGPALFWCMQAICYPHPAPQGFQGGFSGSQFNVLL